MQVRVYVRSLSEVQVNRELAKSLSTELFYKRRGKSCATLYTLQTEFYLIENKCYAHKRNPAVQLEVNSIPLYATQPMLAHVERCDSNA